MKRWLPIILQFLQFILDVLSKKKASPEVSTQDDNVDTIAVGLDMAEPTDEVLEAQENIREIADLSPSSREERIDDIAHAEQLVRDKVIGQPQKPSDNLLDAIRDAERRRDQKQHGRKT